MSILSGRTLFLTFVSREDLIGLASIMQKLVRQIESLSCYCSGTHLCVGSFCLAVILASSLFPPIMVILPCLHLSMKAQLISYEVKTLVHTNLFFHKILNLSVFASVFVNKQKSKYKLVKLDDQLLKKKTNKVDQPLFHIHYSASIYLT